MKKHHLYCTVVFLALPLLAGCICSFRAGASTETSSGKAVTHRNARREKPKAAEKQGDNQEQVATKSTSGDQSATRVTMEEPRAATSSTSASQETTAATPQGTSEQNAPSTRPRLTPKRDEPAESAPSAARSPSGETRSAAQVTDYQRAASQPSAATTENSSASTSSSARAKAYASDSSDTPRAASSGVSLAEQARRTREAMAAAAAASRNGELAKKDSTSESQPSSATQSGQQSASLTGQTSRGSLLIKAPSEKSMICSLAAAQAPRGGKIDVKAQGFGSTPVVRIAGKVLRIIQREASLISAQVPEDSDGGKVTLTAYGVTVECGRLEIIGKNR